MALDVRALDLGVLNSLTKYPSIPTYHSLDPATGSLRDEAIAFSGQVIGTEKVDGTNARIISLPGGMYLLGSREELLYAKGDLIGNPALGIVAELRAVAERLAPVDSDAIRVHYLEVYGGKVTAASKHYTGDKQVGHRLFDVVMLADYEALLGRQPAELSAWRESGGQTFLCEDALAATADRDGLVLTPRLFTVDAGELPTDLDKTRQFLAEHLPRTFSALDDGGLGQPEGIVLRTVDRATIAKARFQDYDRTLRRRERR
ncbi:hypothetical protein GCM10009682_29160 [Luedemannella flava]|uniref:RNA ligase domain-containing protein n=1 Tax=Luedemannella flava TaxID=349316 RepID=A0ABN2M2B9_9ACTN